MYVKLVKLSLKHFAYGLKSVYIVGCICKYSLVTKMCGIGKHVLQLPHRRCKSNTFKHQANAFVSQKSVQNMINFLSLVIEPSCPLSINYEKTHHNLDMNADFCSSLHWCLNTILKSSPPHI